MAADKDEAGWKHAWAVADALRPVVPVVRIFEALEGKTT